MGNDFMDLLSDDDAPKKPGTDERGLGDLLGGLMGGGGQQAGGAGDMADLLGGLMGGGGGQQAGGAGDMADLLGGLMGGGGGQQAGGAGGLSDLLGGLMGGGSAGAGGLGALLGGLLGGGGGAGSPMNFGGGGGGMSLPFAGALAEKLGISEQMANMLIMGAIGLLTSSAAKNRSAGRSGGIDINDLADPDFIRSSGVSSRLSDQMGVSEDEAIQGLQQTLGLMAAGNQPAAATKRPAAKKKTVKTDATAAKKADAPKKTTAKSMKSTSKKKPAGKDSAVD